MEHETLIIDYINEKEIPRWGCSQYDALFDAASKLKPGDWIRVEGLSESKRLAMYTHLSNNKLSKRFTLISIGDLSSHKKLKGTNSNKLFGDLAITKKLRGKKRNAEIKRIRIELAGQAVHGRSNQHGTSNASGKGNAGQSKKSIPRKDLH